MSSPRRIGLPETIRMRHDTHFVDQLTRPSGDAIGRMVPVEDLQPNPRQPRQDPGDLSELKASIREKGMLEPILVRAIGGRYEIIAGERRYRAALEVGLAEVPCIVRDATDAEMMELALVENLQRKDLSPFEEADGLKALVETWGYTHDMMAERLGKSRTSITETLSIAGMPEEVRWVCRRADIHSKSLIVEIVRQADPAKMMALVEVLRKQGSTRSEARLIAKEGKRARGRPRNFVFRYQPREKSYRLALQFRKPQVPREEIIRVLEGVLQELRNG